MATEDTSTFCNTYTVTSTLTASPSPQSFHQQMQIHNAKILSSFSVNWPLLGSCPPVWWWIFFGVMAKELRGPNLRNNWDRGSRLCFSGSSVKLAIYSGHARLYLCVHSTHTYSKDDVTLDLVRGKYSIFNTGSIQWFIEDHAFSSTPSPVTPSVSSIGDA